MSIPTLQATWQTNSARYRGYLVQAYRQDAAGNYLVPADERAFIVDSSFLRIFIEWESFLEEAFVQYLLGNASGAGRAANRHVRPIDPDHARRLLIGTQKYVDWANPEIVRTLARLVFAGGEPFHSILSSINSDLLDLRTIRNAAAHLTSTTSASLDGVATRRLNRTQSHITVADFILQIDPNGAGGATILDGYMGLMDAAVHRISNWR